MKFDNYIKKTAPESTRIVVERAIALSKEKDSRWKDSDDFTSSDQTDRNVEHGEDSRIAMCRNGQ
jgi:hypothetical protein